MEENKIFNECFLVDYQNLRNLNLNYWVPITIIPNLKVEHFWTILENIYKVSNANKLM